MNRQKSRLATLLITLMLLLSMVLGACVPTDTPGGLPDPSNPSIPGEPSNPDTPGGGDNPGPISQEWKKHVSYATPSAMLKVKKNDEVITNTSDALEISAAKNEYESAQLILNAKRTIKSYTIELSDLIMKGSNDVKIDKSNITPYVQHYMYIDEPSKGLSEQGWFPDALVPYSFILAAGENKIDAEANQGFYFTVYVPKGSAAGLYQADIKLTVNDESFIVPLKVNVWDFELSDDNGLKTAFTIWTAPMSIPFLEDAFELPSMGDVNLYKDLYDMLLDYRVNATNLPNYGYEYYYRPDESSEAKKQAFLDDILTATQNTRVNTYHIPVHMTGMDITREKLITVLTDIIDYAKEEELDLLSKAQFYIAEVDEPQSKAAYQDVLNINKSLYDIKKEIANNTKYFPNGATSTGLDKAIRDSLLGLYNIVTKEIISDLDKPVAQGGVEAWVPQIQHFENNTEAYKQRKAQSDLHYWYYTCVDPQHPYPTFHMDDNLTSGRVSKWIAKRHGMEGELYWGVNIWKKYEGSSYVDKDLWVDPATYPGANGDGVMVYPGHKYNYDGFFPAMRLMSHRDGMEDYAYLTILENLVKRNIDTYGLSISFDEVMEGLYNSLMRNDVIPTTSIQVVADARQTVADMILSLNRDGTLIVHGDEKVAIYTAEAVTVTAGGIAQTPETVTGGSRFIINKVSEPLDIIVTKGDTVTTIRVYPDTYGRTVPTITAYPTVSAINYGQSLLDSTITGGAASTAGKFEWVYASQVPGVSTTNKYMMKFIPNNLKEYAPAYFEVAVEVLKSRAVLSIKDDQLLQSERNIRPIVVTSDPAGIQGISVEYKLHDADDSAYTTTVPTVKGSYKVRVSLDTIDSTADSVIKDLRILDKGSLGTFEYGSKEGWESRPVNIDGSPFPAAPNLEISTAEKYSGNASLKATNRKETQDDDWALMDLRGINATFPADYMNTISLYIKGESGFKISFLAFNNEGNRAMNDYHTIWLTGGWEKISFEVTGSSLSRLDIQFAAQGDKGAYEFYIDDIELRSKPYPQELLLESFADPTKATYTHWKGDIWGHGAVNDYVKEGRAAILLTTGLTWSPPHELAGVAFADSVDLSVFNYLQIDVFSRVEDEPAEVYLRIDTTDYLIGISDNKGGWQTLSLDLSEIPSKIIGWHAIYHKPLTGGTKDIPLGYSNLRAVR